MLIFIDMDEVLGNFVHQFIKFHNRTKNDNFKFEQAVDYEMEITWRISRKELVEEMTEFYKSEEFKNITPIPGAKEGIDFLSKDNELVILTARPNHTKDQTKEWVEKHFPGKFSNIYHTNEGSYNEPTIKKVDLCLKLGVDLVIEDALKNAIDCAKKGIKVFLLDYQWNRCEELPEKVTRVYSWQEIIEELN